MSTDDGMRKWIAGTVVLAVLAMGVAVILAVSGCEDHRPVWPCDNVRLWEAANLTNGEPVSVGVGLGAQVLDDGRVAVEFVNSGSRNPTVAYVRCDQIVPLTSAPREVE